MRSAPVGTSGGEDFRGLESVYAVRFGGAGGALGCGVEGLFDIALRSVGGSFSILATASRKFLPYWFLLSAISSSPLLAVRVLSNVRSHDCRTVHLGGTPTVDAGRWAPGSSQVAEILSFQTRRKFRDLRGGSPQRAMRNAARPSHHGHPVDDDRGMPAAERHLRNIIKA
jgi:hypothetical protein